MQQHRLFIDNKRSLIIKSDSSRIHGVIIFMHVSRKLTLHIPTKKSIKLTIYYGKCPLGYLFSIFWCRKLHRLLLACICLEYKWHSNQLLFFSSIQSRYFAFLRLSTKKNPVSRAIYIQSFWKNMTFYQLMMSFKVNFKGLFLKPHTVLNCSLFLFESVWIMNIKHVLKDDWLLNKANI